MAGILPVRLSVVRVLPHAVKKSKTAQLLIGAARCDALSFGVDLRDPLRRGDDDAAIVRLIAGTWTQRGDRYSLLRHAATAMPARKIEMSYIGG